ncbi:MAG: hypothetical protein FJ006_01180 [Chloroflexi bacterium]|nr:hypothetical protein [Chloroflexota bacterium]
MNREERRAERKSRKRKLQWLEMMRKRGKELNKAITALEENFDEDEIENAKAFFADYITDSGPFSKCGEKIDPEDIDRLSRDYGLEPIDGMFILDTLEDMFFSDNEADS